MNYKSSHAWSPTNIKDIALSFIYGGGNVLRKVNYQTYKNLFERVTNKLRKQYISYLLIKYQANAKKRETISNTIGKSNILKNNQIIFRKGC